MRLIQSITTIATLTTAPPKAGSIQEANVKLAIEYYKQVGRQKAFFEFTTPSGKFRFGEYYVMVYDMNGKVLAHGQQSTKVWLNAINAQDEDGKFYIQERIKIARSEGKGWQTYMYINPLTKKTESKRTYFEVFDDLIFCCGAYTK